MIFSNIIKKVVQNLQVIAMLTFRWLQSGFLLYISRYDSKNYI